MRGMGFPASLAPVKYSRGGGLVSWKKQLQRSPQYVLRTRLFLSSFVLSSISRMSEVLMVGEGRRPSTSTFIIVFEHEV